MQHTEAVLIHRGVGEKLCKRKSFYRKIFSAACALLIHKFEQLSRACYESAELCA